MNQRELEDSQDPDEIKALFDLPRKMRKKVGQLSNDYIQDATDRVTEVFLRQIIERFLGFDIKSEIEQRIKRAQKYYETGELAVLPVVALTEDLALSAITYINDIAVSKIGTGSKTQIDGAMLFDMLEGFETFMNTMKSARLNFGKPKSKDISLSALCSSLEIDRTGITTADLILNVIEIPEEIGVYTDRSMFMEGVKVARDTYKTFYPHVEAGFGQIFKH